MNSFIKELEEKFESDIFKNIDPDNFIKIVYFLKDEGIDYVKEIVCDYLDLFTIDYEEFVKKYNNLKKKYGINFTNVLSKDLSILEELLV